MSSMLGLVLAGDTEIQDLARLPQGARCLHGRWTGAPDCGAKQGMQRGLGLGCGGGLQLLLSRAGVSPSLSPVESRPQGLFLYKLS